MTHRLDIQTTAEGTTVLFQGRLDQASLDELATLCRARRRAGRSLRVVLVAGTTVGPGLVEALLRIEGIEVAAESAYLSRWIHDLRKSTNDERNEP